MTNGHFKKCFFTNCNEMLDFVNCNNGGTCVHWRIMDDNFQCVHYKTIFDAIEKVARCKPMEKKSYSQYNVDQAGIFGRKSKTFVSLFLFNFGIRALQDRVKRSIPCIVLYRVYGNVPDESSETR